MYVGDLNNEFPFTNTIISKQTLPPSNSTITPYPSTITPPATIISPLRHHHDHQHNHQATCNCIHHNHIPFLYSQKNATSTYPNTTPLQLPLNAFCKHECMCPNHKLVKRKNSKSFFFLISKKNIYWKKDYLRHKVAKKIQRKEGKLCTKKNIRSWKYLLEFNNL